MQEEHHARGRKLHMCFVDPDKAFVRVSRKVLEWAMRKKGIPEVLVRSVMNLNEGAKTRVRVDCDLSEEFEVKVEMQQWSEQSPFISAVVVDVVTVFAREGALSELLNADDLVKIIKTIQELRNKFLRWKEALKSNGVNVNLGTTKVMICGDTTLDGTFKRNVDACGFCGLRA